MSAIAPRYLSRRNALALLGGGATLLSAPSVFAQAQRPAPRIALLSTEPASDYRHEAFLDGLSRYGHVDKKTIAIEYFQVTQADKLADTAARAVAAKPDLIVAYGTPCTLAAMRATTTIPIVTAGNADILGAGIVTSLTKPGGNVTGVTLMSADISARRLFILQTFVPGLERVVAIHNPDNPAGLVPLEQIKASGPRQKVDVQAAALRASDDSAALFAKLRADGAQALIFVPDASFDANAAKIGQAAISSKLPCIGETSALTEGGLLVCYFTNVEDNYRRASFYVDRIIKGAKPGDLPVELPVLFDFVINKKTSQAIGVPIPDAFMAQATDFIE